MKDDIIFNKLNTIERCIVRINEVYEGDERNLEDFTKQDSIILNLQRACEASIDLSMHIIAVKRLGIPQNSRDAFEILHVNAIISSSTMEMLKRMVGFRNIAVYDYQSIQLEILKAIIDKHLGDFKQFSKEISKLLQ
ncbi:MAG: DUF86 domain-containing protein [Vallitaleaceae bacterium]|nr:DUF86 domain-containing protein [Vallitaleaceae bacterium]